MAARHTSKSSARWPESTRFGGCFRFIAHLVVTTSYLKVTYRNCVCDTGLPTNICVFELRLLCVSDPPIEISNAVSSDWHCCTDRHHHRSHHLCKFYLAWTNVSLLPCSWSLRIMTWPWPGGQVLTISMNCDSGDMSVLYLVAPRLARLFPSNYIFHNSNIECET